MRDLRRRPRRRRSRSCGARSGPRPSPTARTGPVPVSVVDPHAQPAGAPAGGAREPARRRRRGRARSSSSTTAAPRRARSPTASATRSTWCSRTRSSGAAARPRPTAASRSRPRSSSPSSTTTTAAFRTTSSASPPAQRQGPEPVVYSDAVTVVYGQGESGWEPRVRTLQYSLDFDPDYLLLANYIPIHTLLLPRELFRKVGGFDEGLEYSEDWDFLIRLSAETPFRHLRAVTCEYRVFEAQSNDPTHVAAGAGAFQDARRKIFERYAARRTDAGLARVLDRMRAQVAYWYDRDGISQGELQVPARGPPARERGARSRREALRQSETGAADRGERAAPRALAAEYDRLLQEAQVEIERQTGSCSRSTGRRPGSCTCSSTGCAGDGDRELEARRRPRPRADPAPHGRDGHPGARARARALAREFDVRLLVPNDAARGARGRRGRSGRRGAGRRRSPRRREAPTRRSSRATRRTGGSTRSRTFRSRRTSTIPFPSRTSTTRARSARRPPRHDRRTLDARAGPRGFLSLRVAPSSGSSTRARSSPPGASARGTFPADPTLSRLLAVVPFGVPPRPAAGRPGRGRRAVGAPEDGPLVLFGGVYDWYDPELLLEAWPEILRAAPRRAPALLREPEPRDDAAARLRARAGSAPARSIRQGSSIVFSPWLPYSARADLYAAADLLVSISSEGLETELAYRTRLLDAAWGGVPSVSVGGGRSRASSRRPAPRSSARATRRRSPDASSALLADAARRGGRRRGGAGVRGGARSWQAVTRASRRRGAGTRASIRGACRLPAGDALGARLGSDLFQLIVSAAVTSPGSLRSSSSTTAARSTCSRRSRRSGARSTGPLGRDRPRGQRLGTPPERRASPAPERARASPPAATWASPRAAGSASRRRARRSSLFVNDDAAVAARRAAAAGRGARRRPTPDVVAVGGRLTDRSGPRNDFSDGFLTFDGHAFAADVGRPVEPLPPTRSRARSGSSPAAG